MLEKESTSVEFVVMFVVMFVCVCCDVCLCLFQAVHCVLLMEKELSPFMKVHVHVHVQ